MRFFAHLIFLLNYQRPYNQSYFNRFTLNHLIEKYWERHLKAKNSSNFIHFQTSENLEKEFIILTQKTFYFTLNIHLFLFLPSNFI